MLTSSENITTSTPKQVKRTVDERSPLDTPEGKKHKFEQSNDISDLDQESESHTSATSTSSSSMSDTGKENNPEKMEPEADKLPGPGADLNEWGNFLYSCIKSTKQEIADMNTKLKADEANRANTTVALSTITKSVEKLIDRNSLLTRENKELKERLIKLEYYSRRNNLHIEGIEEARGEQDSDCYKKVMDELERLFEADVDEDGQITKTKREKAESMTINRIHRYGPYRTGRTRSIIFNLQWYGDREFIMRERKKLRETIYVNEDFPPEISERRRLLRPILKQALGKSDYRGKASLRYDKLVIRGKEYTLGNLKDLPNDLHPSATCENSSDDVVAFLGIHSPLSNFHPCTIKLDNVTYSSAEQAIQAKAAELFDDDETHYRIMNAHNPLEIKKLSYNIKGFVPQRWQKESYKLVQPIIMQKFCQNEDLMEHLSKTLNKEIVEASWDTLWGCGLGLKHYGVLDKAQWKNDGGMMCRIYRSIKQELGIIHS